MSGGIELHKTKGVNPYLTYCPRCRGEAQEIVMVGANDGVYECDAPISAGGPHKMVGRPKSMRNSHCPECGHNADWKRVGTLEEGVRLRGSQPCDTCQKQMKEHQEVVEAGGVYFECADCRAGGVIKASAPFAMRVREVHQEKGGTKIKEGWFTTASQLKGTAAVFVICGIEFTKKDCPACGPHKDIHNPPKPA